MSQKPNFQIFLREMRSILQYIVKFNRTLIFMTTFQLPVLSDENQPPKSSNRMFSSSTPRSFNILITDAFIIGGPHI